jgi:hypothetical protein
VKQRFVEHFQKLNLKVAKFKNHGYCEPHELYHEKVRIPDKLRE